MHYYKARIQYDGTNLSGFQWQNGTPTVQSEFNQALSSFARGRFSTLGASRTDTGVHALEQMVKITSEDSLDDENFVVRFNQKLSPQIRCLSFAPCEGSFRPTHDSIHKEYRYYFTNTPRVEEADRRFIGNIANELDFELMKKATALYLGTHDFFNFCSMGSNVKTTIRTIDVCELTLINPQTDFPKSDLFNIPPELATCYEFRIVASGFLKQMIRHMVRGIWLVGSQRITFEDFERFLLGPKLENRMWRPASANGLFLYSIKFPED